MRTLLLSLLVGLVVLPANGQDFVEQWRSFLEGTWTEQADSSDLTLEVETTAGVDTLRLSLTGSHAPRSFDRETIECLLQWRTAGQLAITTCPQTTLSRTAPPGDTTLYFPPESKARRGLRKLALKFVGDPRRAGDSLVVGTEKRRRLVKRQ